MLYFILLQNSVFLNNTVSGTPGTCTSTDNRARCSSNRESNLRREFNYCTHRFADCTTLQIIVPGTSTKYFVANRVHVLVRVLVLSNIK